MKFLHSLKVISLTALSLVALVSLCIFLLVPRQALIDTLPPSLGELLPEPGDDSPPAKPEPEKLTSTPSLPVPLPAQEKTHEPRPEPEKSDQAEPPADPVPDQELDLGDPDVLQRVLAKAADFDLLRLHRARKGKFLLVYVGDEVFTGWGKRLWPRTNSPKELCYFRDGLPDGPWVQWQKNGSKKMSGYYKAGEKHGTWTNWKSNGVPTKEIHYEFGKKRKP